MNEGTAHATTPIDAPLRPIPRVVIGAFCERSETATVMEVVFQDRRIRTAISKLRMGGIVAAVDAYSDTPTPNLLIVETLDSSEHARADLERLAEVCDAGTRVIVLGGVNDVSFYKEVTHRGISDYLVTPFEPMAAIAAITGLFSDSNASPLGKLITVTGAKGGVGASTIAHNIGWSMAEHSEQSVVICELDASYGTLSLNFNRDPAQSVAEALRAPERVDRNFVDRMLITYSNRLRLLAGQGVIDDRVDEVAAEAVTRLLTNLRELVPYVILDLPSGWNPRSRAALMDSETIVVCGEPDLASLRNMRNLVEVLKSSRPHDTVPITVLNRTDVPKRIEIPASEFDSSVGGDIDVLIPFDPENFGTAENFGQVVMDRAPDCEATQQLALLAAKCLGNDTVIARKKKGIGDLISGLLRKQKEA